MAPLRPLLPLTLALSCLPRALAWGAMGHETVAYIAQHFVSPSTAAFCKEILGGASNSSASYLASVAPWADSYRYTEGGEFSSVFHYIDANDDPPVSCGVEFERDCPSEGCIVSAIQNYTNLLLDSKSSDELKLDALRFIIHFTGDIHQPLHDEALAVGGNDIAVTFNGSVENLHHIWDNNMPEAHAGGSSLSTAHAWATRLTKKIRTGTYKHKAAEWVKYLDISDPRATAMGWARDANAYVCSTVIEPGLEYLEETDLAGEYFQNARPVFEELIARAGLRLAAWLDLIAETVNGKSACRSNL
ncbi:S1/P1 nuclease [Aspergillus insuetus]